MKGSFFTFVYFPQHLMQMHLSIQHTAREFCRKLEVGLAGSTLPTSSIHFVETESSVLREMPWVQLREHQETGPILKFKEAREKCLLQVALPDDFACIQLVYGRAGIPHHISIFYRHSVLCPTHLR